MKRIQGFTASFRLRNHTRRWKSGVPYSALTTHRETTLEALLQAEGAPQDVSMLYNDWVCAQRKVTDSVIEGLLMRALSLAEEVLTLEEAHALVRQVSEVYQFAEEDMLVVPAKAGVLFVQCCAAVDRKVLTTIGKSVALALYDKLLTEKSGKKFSPRYNGELLAAVTSLRLSEEEEVKLVKEARQFDMFSSFLAHPIRIRSQACFDMMVTHNLTFEDSLLVLQHISANLCSGSSQHVTTLVTNLYGADKAPTIPDDFNLQAVTEYIDAYCGPDVAGLFAEVLERGDVIPQKTSLGEEDARLLQIIGRREWEGIEQIDGELLSEKGVVWLERVGELRRAVQSGELEKLSNAGAPLPLLVYHAEEVLKSALPAGRKVAVLEAASREVLIQGGAFGDALLAAYLQRRMAVWKREGGGNIEALEMEFSLHIQQSAVGMPLAEKVMVWKKQSKKYRKMWYTL